MADALGEDVTYFLPARHDLGDPGRSDPLDEIELIISRARGQSGSR